VKPLDVPPAIPAVPDYTRTATAACIVASRRETDFSGWLAHVIAEAAKRVGGWDHLERRPGSWEAALVERLIAVETMVLTDTDSPVSDGTDTTVSAGQPTREIIDGRHVGWGYTGPLTGVTDTDGPPTDTDTPEG
jgi:hypothetical protein